MMFCTTEKGTVNVGLSLLVGSFNVVFSSLSGSAGFFSAPSAADLSVAANEGASACVSGAAPPVEFFRNGSLGG